ncbi:aspartyl-phosphate phosphatase Spo0E family protein [Bacillus spongiae]|uniref:Aspartyl-phosphate phosphatase Spo0E family protein n=1 Tax=Bacillus spongiae TaxID=2683610 RepID=A0ABU8HIQ8_9BACI
MFTVNQQERLLEEKVVLEIEKLRSQMYFSAKQHGITNQMTVKYSQLLDQAILKAQTRQMQVTRNIRSM